MTESRVDVVRNAQVDLIVDPTSLVGEIRDPVSGEGWRFDPLSVLRAEGNASMPPCRLVAAERAERGAGGIEATIGVGENRYRCAIWLDKSLPDVLFELEPLDEPVRLDALVFPGPLLPKRGAVTLLALPKMLTNGIVYRPAAQDHWVQSLNVASHSGLNMPFWGVEAGASGLLAILETADDVVLGLTKSVHRSLEVDPRWTASLGSIRYARRLRVRLLAGGGYVGMAKAYRGYVIEQGQFKTLAEKIDERPGVRQLVGGPYFHVGYLPFSERKFRQVVAGLRDLGYRNGIIGPIDHIQWGSGAWLNDYQPFIKAPHFAEIASKAGFAAFAWLYLEDILPWDPFFDPSWLAQREDGQTSEGWFNQDYEYQLLCTKVLHEKHRLLKEEMTRFDALHFDTTTSKGLTECWHPEHRMSKSEDRESRWDRLAEVAGWGGVIGSEAGYDWAFNVYDFCSSNPRRAMETGLPVAADHVPLLGLVYHDAVVSYCWEYDPYNKSYFGEDWSREKLLYDAMAGNPPTLSPVLGYFPVVRRPAPPIESRWVTWEDPATQQVLRDALPIAQLHGRTAHQEMIDHAFLDEDHSIARTSYQGGLTVLVNFGDERREIEGVTLEPRGYRIE